GRRSATADPKRGRKERATKGSEATGSRREGAGESAGQRGGAEASAEGGGAGRTRSQHDRGAGGEPRGEAEAGRIERA
ncbi:hypothetical protein C3R44_23995, partial [Mycobacterium tuberculosis]